MATKTTAPEYDFDSWTEEDEKKAIAALEPDVRYIIVENRFIGRFTDGSIIELPFTLSVDDIDGLEETSENPVDQVKQLLTNIGGEEAAASFTSHDIAEAMKLATKFFSVLARVAGATLPE